MKYPEALENFINFYNNFEMNNEVFNKVYSEEIVFQDPFHHISGRNQLNKYFANMLKRVKSCRFVISDVTCGDTKNSLSVTAIVTWDMYLIHKKLNAGKEFVVNGATKIQFTDQVNYHRDYFDSAQLLYKNIPVLGSLIGLIEKGMEVK